ncbi:MAG: PQQ-dependent sugar dehydrogenase [Chitinophagaceae bacterium]|nr:PQQ-dependent sugar dehydrogenase [Chitinophagaceae bacterium]
MTISHTVKRNTVVLLLITAVPFLFNANAQTAPVLIFSPVVSAGLSSPVDVVNAGDGTNRLFMVEQGGRVKIVSGGVVLPGNFLDIPDSISSGGERGLLSIAFHPNFASNRYFFIYYTNTAGDLRITRFQTLAGNPDVADENTGVVLMTIPHPSFSNHNGGKLNFGPDGNLYFGTGDGGSGGDPGNNAQNGNSLLGKLIRINVDNFTTPPYYTIPADNPYISDPLVRDEIFAIGLRNPWRWSFDRLTHDMLIADVGQDAWEEVNVLPFASSGGVNYGWRCYEGNTAYNTTGCQPQSNYTSPVFVYPHNSLTGGFSITGGYVYRGTEFAAMVGYYICSDYVSGNTWLLKSNGAGGWNTTLQAGLPGNIAGFGEAENGDLYSLSRNGTLYKVITSTVLPVTLLDFSATAFAGYNELRWRTANEQNVSFFEIEFGTDGINYTVAGRVNALNIPPSNNYSFRHTISLFTKLFYRLKITDKNGRVTYSDTVELDKKLTGSIIIYPIPVRNSLLNVISEKPVESIAIFSADGKKVFQRQINNLTGSFPVAVPHLQSGIYLVRIKGKDEYLTEKIIINQTN